MANTAAVCELMGQEVYHFVGQFNSLGFMSLGGSLSNLSLNLGENYCENVRMKILHVENQ